ncbi:hypothetical protein ABZ907_05495 [Nonomuraea wenchangensis]
MTAVRAVGSRARPWHGRGPGTGHAVVAGMGWTVDHNASAATALQRLAADEDLTLPAAELDVQSTADEIVPIVADRIRTEFYRRVGIEDLLSSASL